MSARFFRQRSLWGLTIAVGFVWSSAAFADQPSRTFSQEQVFAALIEPNLDAQGKLTSERREHILNAARKMLDTLQLQDFESKLANYAAEQPVQTLLPAETLLPVQLPTTPPQPADGPIPAAPPPLSAQQFSPNADSSNQPLVCGPEWLFGPQGYAYPSWKSGPPSCSQGLLDNATFFIGLDGAKGPEDLGINANMGGRSHVNFAVPILEECGLGVQIGTGINYHNNAVTVLESLNGKQDRIQSFSTVGIFQRTGWGLNWGIVWDYLAEWYWADYSLSQFRGQIGYELNGNNEIGVWGTVGDSTATVNLGGTNFNLRPINQWNLFWKHIWPNHAITRAWVGLAENHNQFVLVIPGKQQTNLPFVYGADVYLPLNDWISLYGEANFITPATTGTVTATFGLCFNLGGRATDYSRSRFAPLLPVANNPTFAVDLAPR